jgi:histidinol-phosphate aminotransferase
VNMFVVVAGKAALADPEHMHRYVAEVLAARTWTVEQLTERGVRSFAAAANYILVWPPGDCDAVVQALRARGILVRSMTGKPVIDGSFRLTIGTGEQMQRFMSAFSEVIRP